MSTRRVRCPSCLTEVPTGGGKAASRCPGCGAKIAADAADAKPAVPPKRKKLRRRPQQVAGFDWIGPLMSLGAAVGLLVVSMGCAGVVYLVTGLSGSAGPSPVPDQTYQPVPYIPPPPPPTNPIEKPPPVKAQGPRPWLAKPDPAPEPVKPYTFAAKTGLPVYGNSLFATGDGPFFVDTVERGLNFDAELIKSEKEHIYVVDLRTGQSAGRVRKSAPRFQQSVLSADGKYLATRAELLRLGGPLVDVYPTEADQPQLFLQETRTVLWMDFSGPGELVMHVRDAEKESLQFWDAKLGARLQDFDLPADLFPLPKNPSVGYQVNRRHGALSPGKKQLALGGPKGIVLVNLSDGKILGERSFVAPEDTVQYYGFLFSADGSELTALMRIQHTGQQRSVVMKTWNVADGRIAWEAPMPELNWVGPPLRGPKPRTVLLSWFESQEGKITYKCQAFNGSSADGPALPCQAVSWLADGQLLVVGAIKDAPEGTPLPPLLDNPKRDDPMVRAIYPVTFKP